MKASVVRQGIFSMIDNEFTLMEFFLSSYSAVYEFYICWALFCQGVKLKIEVLFGHIYVVYFCENDRLVNKMPDGMIFYTSMLPGFYYFVNYE